MLSLEQWSRHLEALAGPMPDGIDGLPPDPTLLSGSRGEQRLWRACAGEDSDDIRALLQSLESGDGGSLLAPDAYLAIEVWAECELAAIHALHRLARLRATTRGSEEIPGAALQPPTRGAQRLKARLDDAVRWHLEHTQPDNSTNRPWAIHAFLLADDPSGESRLYAETLLHNMTATEARQEALSRWILRDAARELRIAGMPSHGDSRDSVRFPA